MLYNVNDFFVEICGELIPAGNIQIFDCYPELELDEELKTIFGLYFCMMFENGIELEIGQEATDIANGWATSLCGGELDHFLVEVRKAGTPSNEIIHAHHVVGEEALLDVLKKEIKINSRVEPGKTAVFTLHSENNELTHVVLEKPMQVITTI